MTFDDYIDWWLKFGRNKYRDVYEKPQAPFRGHKFDINDAEMLSTNYARKIDPDMVVNPQRFADKGMVRPLTPLRGRMPRMSKRDWDMFDQFLEDITYPVPKDNQRSF